MDESGNLGFTRQLARDYFVLALLQTTTPREVGNCISRARSRVLRKKRRHAPELKARISSWRVQNYVLRCLAENPIQIYAAILDKSQATQYQQISTEIKRYFHLASQVIRPATQDCEGGRVVVNLRFRSQLRENFNQYMTGVLGVPKANAFTFQHVDSTRDRGLQAVDFVALAIRNKYQRGDLAGYNLIADRIVWEEIIP
jgi:hypothetical protein